MTHSTIGYSIVLEEHTPWKYTYRFVSHEDFAEFIVQKELSLAPNIFVMCYSGIDDQAINQDILNCIKTLLPQASIMGSTTDGEIFETEVMVHSFVLFLNDLWEYDFTDWTFSAEEDSFKAGQMIAQEGVRLGAKVAIIVADGIVTNGDFDGWCELSNPFFGGGRRFGWW